MDFLRAEHPEPQWERNNWRSLNGVWDFDFDFGKSARDRELFKGCELSKKINVPFCPESDLSGIGYKDFIASVCYKKVITLSKDECENNVFLHFGAVDYESFIYVNGEQAFHHIGGYSSFYADITKYVHEGENVIFVIAEDDLRSKKQPFGKQSPRYASHGCSYTRTTGIWQSVWLEFVPKAYIVNAKYYTDIDNGIITISGKVKGKGTLNVITYFTGKNTGEGSVTVNNEAFTLQIKLSELHLWELGYGKLYDLELKFNDDTVKSYFGMRSVSLDGMKFMLNGKSIFQRLVLDQGYYPDGIYTAKTDDELKKDIELSMNAGFNGARLHQKIFEARFLYHCDKAGYMVWGEHANWGMDYQSPIAAENFINEWMESIDRDFNHPSIIGWCPFNETWGYIEMQQEHRLLETVYKLTKRLDPTRICIDASGNYHVMTDIFDVHDYEGDPEIFKGYFKDADKGIINDQIERMDHGNSQKYNGEPIFVSEYGGISWGNRVNENWGYGTQPKTPDEFIERYKGLTDALLDNPSIMGFCYTQLYDVEQEINGLYTYGRVPKFDMDVIKKINQRKAKIEE